MAFLEIGHDHEYAHTTTYIHALKFVHVLNHMGQLFLPFLLDCVGNLADKYG